MFVYNLSFPQKQQELPEYWMRLMLRRSQRLRLVNWALARPWSVRRTLPWFFTLSLSWDSTTSLYMSKGMHSCTGKPVWKSLSYTSSQWGQITSGIDGLPWDVHAIGGHIHSAEEGAVICLWFAPRSAVWLILNVALNAFLRVTTVQFADLVLSLALRLH